MDQNTDPLDAFANRWSDPVFLFRLDESLRSLFILKRAVQDLDLRGLVVGLEGAPASLLTADFQDTNLNKVDLSQARFSCAFSRACIQETKFEKALFDTCRLKSTRFSSCSFDTANLNSPILDDSLFVQCSFIRAKLTGRGTNEYGGRRIVFEQCDFSGAMLQNLQLRACIFRDCSFETTTFKKCILVGVRFEGQAPPNSSFISCQR